MSLSHNFAYEYWCKFLMPSLLSVTAFCFNCDDDVWYLAAILKIISGTQEAETKYFNKIFILTLGAM